MMTRDYTTGLQKETGQVICELCGRGGLIKEEGVFKCTNCGTRYSLDEARKLFSSNVANSKKTIESKKRELREYEREEFEVFNDDTLPLSLCNEITVSSYEDISAKVVFPYEHLLDRVGVEKNRVLENSVDFVLSSNSGSLLLSYTIDESYVHSQKSDYVSLLERFGAKEFQEGMLSVGTHECNYIQSEIGRDGRIIKDLYIWWTDGVSHLEIHVLGTEELRSSINEVLLKDLVKGFYVVQNHADDIEESLFTEREVKTNRAFVENKTLREQKADDFYLAEELPLSTFNTASIVSSEGTKATLVFPYKHLYDRAEVRFDSFSRDEMDISLYSNKGYISVGYAINERYPFRESDRHKDMLKSLGANVFQDATFTIKRKEYNYTMSEFNYSSSYSTDVTLMRSAFIWWFSGENEIVIHITATEEERFVVNETLFKDLVNSVSVQRA